MVHSRRWLSSGLYSTEDSHLRMHRHENLKSFLFIIVLTSRRHWTLCRSTWNGSRFYSIFAEGPSIIVHCMFTFTKPFLSLFFRVTCPLHLILSDLFAPAIFGEEYKLLLPLSCVQIFLNTGLIYTPFLWLHTSLMYKLLLDQSFCGELRSMYLF